MILAGADVLGPEGWYRRAVGIDGGLIGEPAGARRIDLTGFRVLPGIVDIHGDGFERHLAPRRGVVNDLRPGLMALDAELAANGITTAVLAQFWSWEGGMRAPEFARRLVDALEDIAPRLRTRLLLQLRVEIGLIADYEEIVAFVRDAGIGYVVLNDHLPHAALAAGKTPPRHVGQALKSGRSPEAHLELITALSAALRAAPEAPARLAGALTDGGVLVGSHDDTTETAAQRWAAAGVQVSEFPETLPAARAARAAGRRIVLGAPNVVRGGSHAGNLDAGAALAEGLGDALASDYHYPALLQAVRRLVDDGRRAWPAAWALVSARPAEMLGLTPTGTLTQGAPADLIAIEPGGDRVGLTITGGRIAHLAGEAAHRFAEVAR